jgi:hypothetical protein
MVLLQMMLGGQSLSLMAQYRNEGKDYHTRSRGVSRWGVAHLSAFLIIEGLLALFDPPVAALFLVGYSMNAKLMAEQEATIMSRYLDELDAYVENNYLESAALDECPTEITYLNKPLDKKLNPEVRTNIAGTLVGKPVKGIAKRPRRKASAQQPQETQAQSATPAPASTATVVTEQKQPEDAESSPATAAPPPVVPQPTQVARAVGYTHSRVANSSVGSEAVSSTPAAETDASHETSNLNQAGKDASPPPEEAAPQKTNFLRNFSRGVRTIMSSSPNILDEN